MLTSRNIPRVYCIAPCSADISNVPIVNIFRTTGERIGTRGESVLPYPEPASAFLGPHLPGECHVDNSRKKARGIPGPSIVTSRGGLDESRKAFGTRGFGGLFRFAGLLIRNLFCFFHDPIAFLGESAIDELIGRDFGTIGK